MQKIIQHFFIYLITATILVSGNGVVLSIHTCLASSSKKVSLFKQKSCCSEKMNHCKNGSQDDSCKLNSRCCSSETVYQKISDPFTIQKTIVPPALEFFKSPLFSFSITASAEIIFRHFIPPAVPNSIPIACHQLLI